MAALDFASVIGRRFRESWQSGGLQVESTGSHVLDFYAGKIEALTEEMGTHV